MAKIDSSKFTKTQYNQITDSIGSTIDTVKNIRDRDKTGTRKAQFQEILEALYMAYHIAYENKK